MCPIFSGTRSAPSASPSKLSYKYWYVHFASCFYIIIYCIMGCYYTLYLITYGYSLLFYKVYHEEGNAGSWNSGWKRSKHWKPILHCSKSPETPRKIFLEFIRIIERKKYTRGPTPCLGEWRARPPTRRAHYLLGPLVGLRCPSFAISSLSPWKKSWASLRDETPLPRGGTLAEPI